MRRRSILLTAILLVLAVGCGLLLPQGVSWAYDLSREEVTSYTFDTVRIACSTNSIMEKLDLIRRGATYEISVTETIRTEAEITTLCTELFQSLLPSDAALQTEVEYIEAALVFFGDSPLVIWHVSIIADDLSYIYLAVDDTSGVVLSFTVSSPNGALLPELQGIDLSEAGSENAILNALERFEILTTHLFAEHYQVEGVAIEIDSLEFENGYAEGVFYLSFTFENGETAQYLLHFDNTTLSFN